MTIFYSKSRNSFFDDSIHSPDQIPQDCKEISIEQHQRLFLEQSSGKKIVSDAFGMPTTIEIKEKKLTKKQQNFLEIIQLENQVTPRMIREATLGIGDSLQKIKEIQTKIEKLRG